MKNAGQKHIVFESPAQWHRLLIPIYLALGYKVWMIEPFHAFHYEKGPRFFPADLPAYIEKLIDQGEISLLKAKDLDPARVFLAAPDKAVEIIKNVSSIYREDHRDVIEYTSRILQDKTAENIFYKHLCDRLAVFYSINFMLERIAKKFPDQPIKIYLSGNVIKYEYYQRILSQGKQDFFKSRLITFPLSTYVHGVLLIIKENVRDIVMLSGQMIISGLSAPGWYKSVHTKRKYKYGIALVSAARQLAGNRKGVDFLVDNKKIMSREVVYFPFIKLNNDQKSFLNKFNSDICCGARNKWQNFSHFREWSGLWWIVLRKECLRAETVAWEALRALFEYFKWKKVLEQVEIEHFITHCDMGNLTIARNILFQQKGVQSWYFTDSANFPSNFRTDQNEGLMRQPAWGYLNYDHFVTWSQALVDYFYSHPNLFRKNHVVGCLWVSGTNNGVKQPIPKDGRFTIAVFDSTYSRNGVTSYEEGIAFARDIMRLSKEYADISIIFKEKKDRGVHQRLDPVLSLEFLRIYDQMKACPNVLMSPDSADTARIISGVDLIISFPFTSSTFEAISARRPAIWHDPAGYYRKTIYGKMGNVMTHSYEELKTKVHETRNKKGAWATVSGSPCLDPFCDGRATDRFRGLLVSGVFTESGVTAQQHFYNAPVADKFKVAANMRE